MISIKCKIKNGVAWPLEPMKEANEGRTVTITFVDEETEVRTTEPQSFIRNTDLTNFKSIPE